MKFYKYIMLVACALICRNRLSGQNTIVFNYDAAGNLIERKLQVMQGARIGHFDSPKDSVPHNFKVYPNPTNNYINIEGNLPEHISHGDIILMNTSGQVIKTDTYAGQSKVLDVSGFKPGLYLMEIRYSKKQKDTYKIIITN